MSTTLVPRTLSRNDARSPTHEIVAFTGPVQREVKVTPVPRTPLGVGEQLVRMYTQLVPEPHASVQRAQVPRVLETVRFIEPRLPVFSTSELDQLPR